jgi:hypothetical protein
MIEKYTYELTIEKNDKYEIVFIDSGSIRGAFEKVYKKYPGYKVRGFKKVGGRE